MLVIWNHSKSLSGIWHFIAFQAKEKFPVKNYFLSFIIPMVGTSVLSLIKTDSTLIDSWLLLCPCSVTAGYNFLNWIQLLKCPSSFIKFATVFFQFSSSPRQQFTNIYYFDGSNRIFYVLLRAFFLFVYSRRICLHY